MAELSPRVAWMTPLQPRWTARLMTSWSGLTTRTSSIAGAASAASIVRRSSASTSSRRSSGSRTSPSRDFAPSSALTGISATIGSPGSVSITPIVVSGSANGREDLFRETCPRRVVRHDGVGHEDLPPELADLLRERLVETVEDEVADEVRVQPGDAKRGRLVTERREHAVGRTLQRAAADDPAHRDHRHAGVPPCRD